MFFFCHPDSGWSRLSILVPIALFSSLSRQVLGTRIENRRESKGPSILVPRTCRLRDEKRAMGTRMGSFFQRPREAERRDPGNEVGRENLLMTSAYEHANVRSSVQTLREGEGRLEIFLMDTHTGNLGIPSFLGSFSFRKVRKTLISVCHVNKRSERSI